MRDRNYGWGDYTTLDDVAGKLTTFLGREVPIRYMPQDQPDGPYEELEHYMLEHYPSQSFDVVEVFHEQLDDSRKGEFRDAVNVACKTFGCEWRMLDRFFVRLHSDYLAAEVLEPLAHTLEVQGFEGVLEEFQDALRFAAEGEGRKAISQANNSYESALRVVTGGTGDISALVNKLEKGGWIEDLPAEAHKPFKKFLRELTAVAHVLGRHGQGGQKQPVPREYADLMVHLAAAANLFLLDQYVAKQGKQKEDADPFFPIDNLDDDIPF